MVSTDVPTNDSGGNQLSGLDVSSDSCPQQSFVYPEDDFDYERDIPVFRKEEVVRMMSEFCQQNDDETVSVRIQRNNQ